MWPLTCVFCWSHLGPSWGERRIWVRRGPGGPPAESRRSCSLLGAGRGNRTHMGFLPRDFKFNLRFCVLFLNPLLPLIPPRLDPERQQYRADDHHAFHEDAKPVDLSLQLPK